MMGVTETKKKLAAGSVHRKKAEKDIDDLLKKELLLVYNAYAAFANAYEQTFKKQKRRVKLPEHLDRAIIQAETYPERDLLCRRLASQCYKFSKMSMKNGDYKQSVKWMHLALRFIRLSMDPKKQAVDEKFTAELEALERKIEKLRDEETEGVKT